MKNLIIILSIVFFALNINAQVETDTLYENGKVIMVQKTIVDSFPKILSPKEAQKYSNGEIVEKDKSFFVVNSFFPFVKEEVIIREAFKKGSKNNAVTELPGEKKVFWWGITFFMAILIWNISRAYASHIYYLPKRKNFLSLQITLFLIVITSWVFIHPRWFGTFYFTLLGLWTIMGIYVGALNYTMSKGGTIGMMVGLLAGIIFLFLPPTKLNFSFPTEMSLNSLIGTIFLITISFTLSIFLYEKRRRKIKKIKEFQKRG